MTAENRLARMTWRAVDQYLQAHPEDATVFIPIGPIEEHGRNHMVLGADIVQAVGIIERLAERHHGLIFPAIPLMACGISKPVTGTIAIDADTTLKSMARDLVTEFVTKGYRKILFFTGHGGYSMVKIREAIVEVKEKLGNIFKAEIFNFEEASLVQANLIPDPKDMHAAGREISRMLVLDPDGVCQPYPPADYHKDGTLSASGITGDPATASREIGEAIVADTLQYLSHWLTAA